MSRKEIISHINEIHKSAFEFGYISARADASRICDAIIEKIKHDPEINNPNITKEPFSKSVILAVIQELTYLDPEKKYKQFEEYKNKG